ncbi:MAG: ABC transporter substrate-binding protein [Anaerolineales bacterium]
MKLAQRILLFLLTSALLASCGAFQPTSASRPLRVEFTQWWGDYTLIIAKEKGFFAKYGVDVEPVYYETFSDALPDLAAGDIDMGLFALGDALNVSRHTDLKVIAVYDNGGFNAVLAAPSIRSIGDLRGKSIGVQLGTTYELFVLDMLRISGLSTSDVNLVDVDPENIPARIGQDIAAGFAYEPYISEAMARGFRVIFSSEQVSGLNPDVIVMRSELAQQRPEDVRAFLRAWFEAVEYRKANDLETRQIIANYMGWNLEDVVSDPQIQLLTVEDNRVFFDLVPSGPYRPLRETAQSNGQFLIRIGTLTKLPNFDTFLDPSFLE